MDDFVFKYIFETEKDKPWSNSNWFRLYIRKKYNITNQEDGTKLYTAINRYQVKKYGGSIEPRFFFYSEDYIKKAIAVRNAKHNRKR